MMTSKKFGLAIAGLAMMASGSAYAVPTLQVGAYAGAGDSGTYADYIANTINPTETDTAITGNSTILVAGSYSNSPELLIGGQYSGSLGTGSDWSDFGFDSVFNGSGAILMASVAEGSSLTDLTVNGSSAIFTSLTDTYFPNEHDPAKDNIADFMYFDIGDFGIFDNVVTNLATEDGSWFDGEVKELLLGGLAAYDWIHFDVMALVTDTQGKTSLVTTLDANPGSKDLTWKTPGDEPPLPPNEVPAPGVLFLMGVGLLAMGVARRAKKS